MSNIEDLQNAIAGTMALDKGGRTSVDDLFDVYVGYQHAAPDAAAGDTWNKNIYKNTRSCSLLLVEAIVIPDANLTAADATKLTLTVFTGVAGAVTTNAASVNTATGGGGGSGNWTADTPVSLTLSATLANRVLAAGSIVCVDKAVTSTGTIHPAGRIQLKFRRI